MSDALQKAKEEVLWGCRLMVERGYLLGTVGNLSARVRDGLWLRVCENLDNGKATMVYSTNHMIR